MAKVKLGPLVSDIRGKLGSVVFRRQGGQATIQQASGKRREASDEQKKVIAYSAGAARLWSTRTDRDMRSWENWAIQHPITYPDGSQKAPAIYPVFAARYCKSCWCSTPIDFCKITYDPTDNETLIRAEIVEGTSIILLKVYGITTLTFFTAGWFRLVNNPRLKNSNKKWRPAWNTSLNNPNSYQSGTDTYGSYKAARLESAGEYIFSFATESCYLDIHTIAATQGNFGYATRDIYGVQILI